MSDKPAKAAVYPGGAATDGDKGFFGGSYGGDASKITGATKLECKICWHLYDPAKGDDYWQIPPGTPFSQLPEHWTCPNCDSAKEDFMVVE